MNPPFSPIFETHSHLNHAQFDGDREEVIARARAAGVGEIIIIGCDPESYRRAAEMADPENGIFITAGLHPHDAQHWSAKVEADIRSLAAREGTVALGEIGLDFYRDLSPRDAQYTAFRAQLDLAAELGMPIVVHTRESMSPCLDVLAPYARAGLRGVMHCWSGTLEEAHRALDLGFLLGIGGVLTYKNPGSLPEVVTDTPLDRLVLETDCPYLAPVPHRGKRNEPAFLPLIAQRIAEIKTLPIEEVTAGTRAAARWLFLRDKPM